MAGYDYQRRKALAREKLRAAGVAAPRGKDPAAYWRTLNAEAKQYAVRRYVEAHPGYRGGGRQRVKAAPAPKPARQPRVPLRTEAGGDVLWRTKSPTVVLRALRGADKARPRQLATVQGRFWCRHLHTGREGFYSINVGEHLPYLEVLRGPIDKVLVTVGPSGNVDPGDYLGAFVGAGGDVWQALRDIINEGGFE